MDRHTDTQNDLACGASGADPKLPLGGSISPNVHEAHTKFLKPRPLSRKPRPFFMRIHQSDQATTAMGQRSSNLCQGK